MLKKRLYNCREIKDLKELIDSAEKLFGDNAAFKFKKENFKNVTTIAKPEEKNNLLYLTYKQFKKDIDCLGTVLNRLDLKEKRIALISDNRYEWCVSYFSIVAGNNIIIPLDRSLPENEIESCLIRSKAEVIIFEDKYSDIIKKIQEEGKTNVKYFICFEKEYIDLLKQGEKLLLDGNRDFLDMKIDTEKMKIMLFTSGTTQTPKVVMLSHKNIVSNLMSIRQVLNVYENDISLVFLPLHHTLSCMVFLMVVYNGASNAFCDGIKHIAQNLVDYKASVLICVPALYENMYKRIIKKINDSGKKDIIKIISGISNILLKFKIDVRKKIFKEIHSSIGGNIRLLMSGAAPIDKNVVIGFNTFGLNLVQGYGLTEASPVISIENDKYKKMGSIGLPLPDIDVKIDSPDENGIGEIVVKGPNIMIGYYENDHDTEEVLKDDWFYTGDLGYLDKQGFLFITGRKKNVIVLKNGKNIFPEEIEFLISKNEYIEECMVYGKPDRDNDLKLGVKVVYSKAVALQNLGKIKKEQIKEILWKHIKEINKTMPSYKYIRDIIITDIPLIKTTTQKVKRQEELKLILKEI